MDVRAIEERWHRAWEEQGTYRTPAHSQVEGPEPSARPKMYVLDFFPYPSGDGLSVGHARNYVPTDVLARYFRMRGDAVLHPMGWDAFGLPAENEAILKQRHPRETTREYSTNYRRQLRLIGCSYDWSREINTSDPPFYRWTQWGFLLLLHRGLAYRATGWQWWCPKCRTILANEQVENGRCWRHGDTPVERRALEQWYVRTTAYAERLLADLDGLDWPEHIKTMQRNWIGRSEGVDVHFPLRGMQSTVTVFTTRADTIFGATFIVLAPEHPMAAEIAAPERRQAVGEYIQTALRRSEIERMARATLTGIFTGASAAHPFTGAPLPIYIADYVLAQYGSGAVMGVPAHDGRDHAFATTFGLPIHSVVAGGTGSALPYEGEGTVTDSGEFSGLSTAEARRRLAEALGHIGRGAPSVRYRMRDWLISRQRYWGAPIPVVHCQRCGVVPVPDAQLPVLLPDVQRHEPSGTGRSPLAAIAEFVETSCPRCAGPARRETDTLDGFADSNWYFLRFTDPHYQSGPWDPRAMRYWMPVDWYIGGAEQAVMHLLYARFFTKVLYDAGLVPFAEPFVRLRSQGSMLSPVDGLRMSKSRGNVVTPDEVVEEYGADALRVAVMFIGPFEQDVTWDPAVAAGAARFVRRLHALLTRNGHAGTSNQGPGTGDLPREVRFRLHRLIKTAGEAIERFRFNTLVSDLMTLLNEAERWEARLSGTPLWTGVVDTLVRICAPVMPFLAEDAWHAMGREGSVHDAQWPEFDPALAEEVEHTVIIQIDGRVRGRVTLPSGVDRDTHVRRAAEQPRIRELLRSITVREVIVVPGKIVNFVTEDRT